MFATLHLAPATSSRRAVPLAVGLLAVAGLALAGCSSSGSSEDAAAQAFEMRPVTNVKTTVNCSAAKPSNKPTDTMTLCNGANQQITLGPAAVVTSDVASVKATTGKGKHAGPIVAVTLTKDGRQKLATSTGNLINNAAPLNTIAILSNGTVVASPAVSQPIAGGVVQLGGIENKADAQALAKQIRAGIATK